MPILTLNVGWLYIWQRLIGLSKCSIKRCSSKYVVASRQESLIAREENDPCGGGDHLDILLTEPTVKLSIEEEWISTPNLVQMSRVTPITCEKVHYSAMKLSRKNSQAGSKWLERARKGDGLVFLWWLGVGPGWLLLCGFPPALREGAPGLSYQFAQMWDWWQEERGVRLRGCQQSNIKNEVRCDT